MSSQRTHLVVRFAIAVTLLFVIAVAVFICGKDPSAWGATVVSVTPKAAASVVPAKAPAAAAATPAAKKPKRPLVPTLSVGYRIKIERAVSAEFGVLAPVAEVAAQLQQESAFNADAQSPYAIGLAQFTPATAKWLPTICPQLGEFDPWDADQSILAAACYDKWLHKNVRNAATECDRLAFMLSDYNGGTKWRQRDQAAAAKAGSDSTRWFGGVETSRSRSMAAHEENRAYVRRILLVLTPAYVAEGWPGGVTCT